MRLLITTIQIKTNMLGQHEQKCSATGRSSSHLTRLRISLKPHPKFTFQMTGVHDGCCTPLGFLPLGLWLCCFWLSGSVASGVPVAFLSLSLLLCLGPSGGDRGPQAQKPPNLETTNPPAPISASLRAPLARNGAPIYRKKPVCCTPLGFLSGSLALWLCCFWRPRCLPFLLSFSAWGDRGPQAQKPHKLETTTPLAPISASLRAPLAGNGAPIYRKSPSVALPWASSLALWLCCFWLSGSAASGVPVAFPLSFSAWGPLAGTGARKPKSHPN